MAIHSTPRVARVLLYTSVFAVLFVAVFALFLLLRREAVPQCTRSPEDLQFTLEAGSFCVIERPSYDPYDGLFEVFSLYSLAKDLRRTPVIKTFGSKDERRRVALFEAFPVLRELFDDGACLVSPGIALQSIRRVHVRLSVPSPHLSENMNAVAAASDERNLQLSSICESKDLSLLESVRTEVRQRLTGLIEQKMEQENGGSPATANVEDGELGRRFIVPNTDVKICVHLQRSAVTGDFSTTFVFDTIERIVREDIGGHRSVSILLFGDIRQAEYETLGFYSSGLKYMTLAVQRSSAEEAWVVAGRHCHSILLTAPDSSAGWWLAFLAPPTTRVFYVNGTSTSPSHPMPSSWTPLPPAPTGAAAASRAQGGGARVAAARLAAMLPRPMQNFIFGSAALFG